MPDHTTPTPDAIDAAARQLLGETSALTVDCGTLAAVLPRYAMSPPATAAFSRELDAFIGARVNDGLSIHDAHLAIAGELALHATVFCDERADYPPERMAELTAQSASAYAGLRDAHPPLAQLYILSQMLLSLTSGICVANQRARAEQREAGDV